MKLHKFEVYVIDYEDLGVEAYREIITGHERLHGSVACAQTVDIEPWSDQHPLNMKEPTPDQFRAHFFQASRPPGESFLISCARGKAKPEDIDDWIDAWHEADTGMDLPEYLGLSELQYRLFVLGRLNIHTLVAESAQKLKFL